MIKISEVLIWKTICLILILTIIFISMTFRKNIEDFEITTCWNELHNYTYEVDINNIRNFTTVPELNITLPYQLNNSDDLK